MPVANRELVGVEHEGQAHETADAILFSCQDREVWIPKSELEDYDDQCMVIPRWLADARNLEPDWEL
jgi:hypothetical protein